MSNEKKLIETIKTRPSDSLIYTNGCYLIPYKLHNGKWGWVATFFEEDSFHDGEYVNVVSDWSDNPEQLVGGSDED